MGDLRVMNPSSILQPLLPLPLAPQDFLRCLSAIIIFLVVSFAAVTSREGAAIAAFVSSFLQCSPVPRTCGWYGHTSCVPKQSLCLLTYYSLTSGHHSPLP